MRLFQCQVCHSKILESNLQKHHAKVHADVDHDIYILLTTNDTPPPAASNTDAEASMNWFQNISSAADEKLVHVSCTICGNKMPFESLDQHMKRKHNDVCDQVDAVGTKVNTMSIDLVEKSEAAKVATAAKEANGMHEQFQGPLAAKMLTSWPKAKNPFRFTATPKIDATTTTDPDSQPFYTVRVSVDQMKQLMSENRIEPKEGHFYLK